MTRAARIELYSSYIAPAVIGGACLGASIGGDIFARAGACAVGLLGFVAGWFAAASAETAAQELHK